MNPPTGILGQAGWVPDAMGQFARSTTLGNPIAANLRGMLHGRHALPFYGDAAALPGAVAPGGGRVGSAGSWGSEGGRGGEGEGGGEGGGLGGPDRGGPNGGPESGGGTKGADTGGRGDRSEFGDNDRGYGYGGSYSGGGMASPGPESPERSEPRGGNDNDGGSDRGPAPDPTSGPGDPGSRDPFGGAYGKGGIVTKRTRATIGEKGPEAVVPLRRGHSPSRSIVELIRNERRTKGVNNPHRGGLPPKRG
jgi:hypothetical protein